MTPVDIGNAAQIISAVTSVCLFGATLWIAISQRAAVSRATTAAAEAKTAALEMANAARWHETPFGKAVIEKVDKSAGRLDIVEDRLIHVATREDVARVSGEIASVARAAHQAVAGIDRLEGYFLAEGVKGRS